MKCEYCKEMDIAKDPNGELSPDICEECDIKLCVYCGIWGDPDTDICYCPKHEYLYFMTLEAIENLSTGDYADKMIKELERILNEFEKLIPYDKPCSGIASLIDIPENWNIEGYHCGHEVMEAVQSLLDNRQLEEVIIDMGEDYQIKHAIGSPTAYGSWWLERTIRDRMECEGYDRRNT